MIQNAIASRQQLFAEKPYRDPGHLIAVTAPTCREHIKMSAFAVSCAGACCYIKDLQPVFLRRKVASYRHVEDFLAERGLDISYETVRSWGLDRTIGRKIRIRCSTARA
jgi:hypothetical protein